MDLFACRVPGARINAIKRARTLGFVSVVLVACHHRPVPPAAAPVITCHSTVPPTSPNHPAPGVDDETQWVRVGGVTMHRSILILRFFDAVAQSDRGRIVDAVCGEVVGGRSLAGGREGFYFLSIPTPRDSSAEAIATALNAASDKLNAMPGVRFAIPYFLYPYVGPPRG